MTEDSGGNERDQPHESQEAGSDGPVEPGDGSRDPWPSEPAPHAADDADQDWADAGWADQGWGDQDDPGTEAAEDDDTGPVPATIAAAAAGSASKAAGPPPRGPGPVPPGKRVPRPRRRWFGGRYRTSSVALGGLATLLAVVLVAGFLTAYMKYREVWDSITHVDVSADLHSSKLPPPDPNALNLLLIGSDSRVGKNGAIGGSTGISGARSDTVMLVHVAPGESQIDVISFPRDTVVPILSCTPEDGTTGQTAQPGQVEQLNATFAYGGPGCLWETLEETTGIHIDDFIELTFVGFVDAINALGGVNVCVPAAIDDPMSGLDISAGHHHIYGKMALAFWRTREDLGEGDDPQRIQRDQYLMASLLQGIEKSGLLNSPGKILGVIDALSANHNISIDDQLTPTRLLKIAEDLHGISTESVQFVTSPYTTYDPNPNWVQWEEPQAQDLFSAIAHDNTLPKSDSTATKTSKSKGKSKKDKGTKAASQPTPTPQSSSTTTVQPAQIQVAVYNGTTTSNLATTTSAALTARGFDVIGQPLDAASDTYTDSVIQYASSADLAKARYLAQEVGPSGDVKLQLDPQLSAGTMNLILGSTFSALQPVPSSSALQNIASTYGGISGNVNICTDQAAFSGPDGD
jgi:LCP family protein required for cell wall assembly